jgi:hypothetical protein
MLRKIAIAAGLTFALAAPCSAWTVAQNRDKLTDKANVKASTTSGGATLLVGCLQGHVEPRLVFPRRIGYGRPSASYRFDDGPVTPRIGSLSGNGTTLYLWTMDHADALEKLRNAKRFRVQFDGAFFDFDLTQGGKELPAISCKG